jgi:hypothetical protein
LGLAFSLQEMAGKINLFAKKAPGRKEKAGADWFRTGF